MYRLLDLLFVVFHWLFIVFILAGWIWSRTRRAHLIITSLTMVSWFGLGFWYGLGYCPCTDWHWQVKARLGEAGLPASYVKYYLDFLTGLEWDSFLVDTLVAVLGLAAFCLSLLLNWRGMPKAGRLSPGARKGNRGGT